MAASRYVFDNAATAETGLRFAGAGSHVRSLYDRLPDRGRRDRRVGVLEIGAGGGSIARWLAERVGPTGSVLATDIDPRFIPPRSWGISRWPVTTSAPMRSRWLATISSTPGWS